MWKWSQVTDYHRHLITLVVLKDYYNKQEEDQIKSPGLMILQQMRFSRTRTNSISKWVSRYRRYLVSQDPRPMVGGQTPSNQQQGVVIMASPTVNFIGYNSTGIDRQKMVAMQPYKHILRLQRQLTNILKMNLTSFTHTSSLGTDLRDKIVEDLRQDLPSYLEKTWILEKTEQ